MEEISKADIKMTKTVETYQQFLSTIRTSRPNPNMLDHLEIEYHGTKYKIKQLAMIYTNDPQSLVVQPFDQNSAKNIEKTIRDAQMGLNPVVQGQNILIPLPSLNEERRKELIKIIKSEAETTKGSLRNVRRDANSQFATQVKNKEMSEDELTRAQASIQKLIDKYIGNIDLLVTNKEREMKL